MRARLCLVVACLLHSPLHADDVGISAPEGFEVSLYAGDELAHDIYSMTIDAHGRVVVAGAGYVKTLHDDDADGKADRATLFSNKPGSGAHGMYFDGPDLICTGDNSVMRLRDTDGDGEADGKPEILTSLRHPEHGANGLVKGPDGWIYLICGNDAGMSSEHASLPGSPVKDPRCGGVIRFRPDGHGSFDGSSEVVAHGFRNPYDLDFSAAGHLFTVDADGERDYHLPWYAPTRLFDVAVGMEHGWLLQGWTRSWNRPAVLLDSGERLVEIGRGSPTGLTVYRHRQFPPRYYNGVLSACWTLGKVWFLPLAVDGAGYESQREVFLETTTGTGFAPCDLAVGPDGDLLVAIGGRRTRGSVFRVRYVGEHADASRVSDDLTRVLTADQPLSSWSRARWIPVAKRLGPAAFLRAIADAARPSGERVRAVEVVTELFDGIDVKSAEAALPNGGPLVSARVAWSLGRQVQTPETSELLHRLTSHESPAVQRAAWEALLSQASVDAASAVQPNWRRALISKDRRIRSTAIWTAAGSGAASYEKYQNAQLVTERTPSLEQVADWWIRRSKPLATAETRSELLERCGRLFEKESDERVRLDVLRLMQLGLGDARVQSDRAEVFTGYQAADAESIDPSVRQVVAQRLVTTFPCGDADVDAEIARTVGMLGVRAPGLLEHLVPLWNDHSAPADDIHHLIVAGAVPGERSERFTDACAETLVQLSAKMRDRGYFPSQNWPLRVGEAFVELCKQDNRLASRLIGHPSFGHPDHALYAKSLKGAEREGAIRRLVAAADQHDVTPEVIALAGELLDAEQRDDKALNLLRGHIDEPALRDACVLALARWPSESDHTAFVSALSSVQPQVVEQSASALRKLGGAGDPAELLAVLRALRHACLAPPQRQVRQALSGLLAQWSGKSFDIPEMKDADFVALYQPWFDWFAADHPKHAKSLQQLGADLATWQTRLAAIEWGVGDIERGKSVFEKQACHRCHRQSGQLGPDLPPAIARMSREDLFVAILEPNKEVSETYQTKLAVTKDGQVQHGLVVYESPEATLLQTSPDTTVRFTAEDQVQLQPSWQSLMPSGLLDNLKDQEIADLYAYLKSLTAK